MLTSLSSILISIVVFHTAMVLGLFGLRLLGFKNSHDSNIFGRNLAVLFGYGVLAYIALVVAAFGPISKISVWFVLVAPILVGHRLIVDSYTQWISQLKASHKKWGFVEKTVFLLIVGGILFYLTSALVPPYRTDALAYHIPEAESISQNGFHAQVGDSLFFGNLPVLMETLYGFVYTIGGHILIHLAHFQILLSMLGVLYGFLKKEFSSRAGLISVLLVFSLYELFVNGTNSYIDAAATSFEVVGLISLVRFIAYRETNFLRLSGAMYGLAMATKYNALYGLILGGLIALVAVIRMYPGIKMKLMYLLRFCFPLMLFGSFWYIKNAIFYHNPVFPFYFGHPGFTDLEYRDLTETIKLFEMDRTVWNFFKIPFHFFLTPYYLIVFVAIFLWPFVPLAIDRPSHRSMIKLFSFYIFAYTVLWFFLATHQLKFFFVPMVLLLVILGLVLERLYTFIISRKSNVIRYASAGGIALLVVFFGMGIVKAKDGYFLKTKVTELRYVVGVDDAADFYSKRNLGNAYAMSMYINSNFEGTDFFSVWSTPAFFLSKGNTFVSPYELYYDGSDINTTTLMSYLKAKGIEYIVIDGYEHYQSFNEPIRINNQAFLDYRHVPDSIEQIVPEIADLVYEVATIQLYKIR